MDQADKLKLTKFGFHLNLLGASSFLSVLGIIVSSIGIIGGLIHYFINDSGALILIPFLLIPYLFMWILLKIMTKKQDVPAIERIGKVYSYVSSSFEIIAMIIQIIFSALAVKKLSSIDVTSIPASFIAANNVSIALGSVYMIFSVIYLVFACLKIHGVRVENNKLIGTYIGFRYGLIAIFMILLIILNALRGFDFIIPIYEVVYFILDIGLTVILHSIWVDREKTAGTENPMKNF